MKLRPMSDAEPGRPELARCVRAGPRYRGCAGCCHLVGHDDDGAGVPDRQPADRAQRSLPARRRAHSSASRSRPSCKWR